MKASLRRRASQPAATTNRDWAKPDFRPSHLGVLPVAAPVDRVAKNAYFGQHPGTSHDRPRPTTHRRVMSRTGGK